MHVCFKVTLKKQSGYLGSDAKLNKLRSHLLFVKNTNLIRFKLVYKERYPHVGKKLPLIDLFLCYFVSFKDE